MRKLRLRKSISLSRLYSKYTMAYIALFVCAYFLKEWVGQTILNDFQDAFVVDFCVSPEG